LFVATEFIQCVVATLVCFLYVGIRTRFFFCLLSKTVNIMYKNKMHTNVVLIGIPDKNRQFGLSGRSWKDNGKMHLR